MAILLMTKQDNQESVIRPYGFCKDKFKMLSRVNPKLQEFSMEQRDRVSMPTLSQLLQKAINTKTSNVLMLMLKK